MSDNRTDALMAFLLGAAVGAGVALLLAPQSGEETRRQLGDGARRLGHDLDERLQSAKGELAKRAHDVKEELTHRASDLKEELATRTADVKTAVNAGRDAYARARTAGEPGPTSNAM
jgi:gas vesicle protein